MYSQTDNKLHCLKTALFPALTCTWFLTRCNSLRAHLPCHTESDNLRQERSRKTSFDQHAVAKGRLIDALSHHPTGKFKVVQAQALVPLASGVGVDLQHWQKEEEPKEYWEGKSKATVLLTRAWESSLSNLVNRPLPTLPPNSVSHTHVNSSRDTPPTSIPVKKAHGHT